MDWVHCPIAKKKRKKKERKNCKWNENKHALGSKAHTLTITPSLASHWSPLVSDCVCKATCISLFILTLFPLISFVSFSLETTILSRRTLECCDYWVKFYIL